MLFFSVCKAVVGPRGTEVGIYGICTFNEEIRSLDDIIDGLVSVESEIVVNSLEVINGLVSNPKLFDVLTVMQKRKLSMSLKSLLVLNNLTDKARDVFFAVFRSMAQNKIIDVVFDRESIILVLTGLIKEIDSISNGYEILSEILIRSDIDLNSNGLGSYLLRFFKKRIGELIDKGKEPSDHEILAFFLMYWRCEGGKLPCELKGRLLRIILSKYSYVIESSIYASDLLGSLVDGANIGSLKVGLREDRVYWLIMKVLVPSLSNYNDSIERHQIRARALIVLLKEIGFRFLVYKDRLRIISILFILSRYELYEDDAWELLFKIFNESDGMSCFKETQVLQVYIKLINCLNEEGIQRERKEYWYGVVFAFLKRYSDVYDLNASVCDHFLELFFKDDVYNVALEGGDKRIDQMSWYLGIVKVLASSNKLSKLSYLEWRKVFKVLRYLFINGDLSSKKVCLYSFIMYYYYRSSDLFSNLLIYSNM